MTCIKQWAGENYKKKELFALVVLNFERIKSSKVMQQKRKQLLF